MLEPQDRRLLLDALRPPPGYALDHAVGTTYSLDLIALLTAPLAFTAFDWEDEEGRPPSDPYSLLAALRQHAARITVFCELGQIAVPPAHQRLLAELEESVVQVRAPRHAEGGVFHPKVWLLRYTAKDQPVVYRLLCLSRNLTFDRSWDLALVLEGTLKDRKNAYALNHDLGDFIGALPDLAVDALAPARAAAVDVMQDEVRRVAFEPPEGLEVTGFWPLGLGGDVEPWPFDTRIDRLLVISPFIGPSLLGRLAARGREITLVSREDELAPHAPDELGADEVYVLDRAAAPQEPEDVDDGESPTAGLHAKVYVADQGWRASVWVGSANATAAAFSRNVEFLVELEGAKSAIGVKACLAGGGPGQPSFRDLLIPWVPPPEPELDPVADALEQLCDDARRSIAAADLRLEIDPASDGLHECRVRSASVALEADVTATCWLATQGPGAAAVFDPAGEPAAALRAATADITPFLSFEVRAQEDGREHVSSFTVKARLVGDPPGRREAVLRGILRDRLGLIRLLLLLLTTADDTVAALLDPAAFDVADGGSGERDGGGPGGIGLPLLEPLLMRAARQPETLRPLGRMIEDLRATPEGRELLSDGVLDLWDAVWAAVGTKDADAT